MLPDVSVGQRKDLYNVQVQHNRLDVSSRGPTGGAKDGPSLSMDVKPDYLLQSLKQWCLLFPQHGYGIQPSFEM